MKTTDSGLQYEDVTEGSGESPVTGQTCVVHYTGWLWVNDAKGSKFDSSKDRGQPFSFPVGRGQVIKGWDEGVATMKVGGQRNLLIPPTLGYGARGRGRRHTAQAQPCSLRSSCYRSNSRKDLRRSFWRLRLPVGAARRSAR